MTDEFYDHAWLPDAPARSLQHVPTLVLDLTTRYALVIVRADDHAHANWAYVIDQRDGDIVQTVARVLNEFLPTALPFIVARAHELAREAVPPPPMQPCKFCRGPIEPGSVAGTWQHLNPADGATHAATPDGAFGTPPAGTGR